MKGGGGRKERGTRGFETQLFEVYTDIAEKAVTEATVGRGPFRYLIPWWTVIARPVIRPVALRAGHQAADSPPPAPQEEAPLPS